MLIEFDLVDGLNLEIKTNGVKEVTPWSLMIETFNSLNHRVFSLNERVTNVAKSCWRLNDQGNFETKLGFVGSVRAIERAISNLNCFHGLTINFHFETREKFGFKNESITCWFKKGELEVAKRIGLECIEESLSKWGDNIQIRKYGTTTPYVDYEWSEEGALKIERQNDFYFMSNELSDLETFEHFINKASTSWELTFRN